MEWYSSSQSPFAADMDAPPGGGFGVNVFLRDGDTATAHGARTGEAPSNSVTRLA